MFPAGPEVKTRDRLATSKQSAIYNAKTKTEKAETTAQLS
jgi:hypothetical protein